MRAVSFVCKAEILLKAFSYLSRPVCLLLITQMGLQMKQTKKPNQKQLKQGPFTEGAKPLIASDLIKK